ncbi:MAG: HAMP domain-containing histidine kinase [Spirochaetales bacterium]|jgi:two-component system sensor histidine kinase HydH|nr:HAMP domain-containing histidine kinase [Spirochaetales bacterium]
MKNQNGLRKTFFLSLLGTAGVFILCSVFGYGLLRSQLYANLLLARNDAEQTQSSFFTALRQERFQDERFSPGGPRRGEERENRENHGKEGAGFEEVFELYPQLKEKIAGIGSYARNGKALFRYGEVPDTWIYAPDDLDTPSLRNYIMDEESGSIRIITLFPPPHKYRNGDEERMAFLLFSVRQDAYKSRNRTAWLVFAGWELFLVLVIGSVRNLLAKNRAYRRKIQEQKELVALGSAARTLAHEIKNPLSAIQLQADIIDRVCPKKVTAEIEAITQEVGRLKRLTDRIGDFLREPKGMPAAINLAGFTKEFLQRSGTQAVFSAEEGLWVLVDSDRLQSIVSNLLRNAVESGGPPEDLEVKLSRSGNSALLEVLDRGAGLPEGSPDRLFDPFFTTKNKGSGVGLSIARRFTEAAGGFLKIENREGGGVRASVLIPLIQNTKEQK